MFDPIPDPRVFALPAGVDFSQGFVDGLLARLKDQPPEALARVVIYVNTRRSARKIEALFCAGAARLLPDIRVITELAQDPHIALPPAMPPLRRQLILAQLVSAYIAQQPDVAPQSAAFDLADSLGGLLDSFQGEGVALDALRDISVTQQSGHWERALEFLEILGEYWNHGRSGDFSDTGERQRAVVCEYARRWAIQPPDHPVIVAGSTGSRGATAVFMRAVANLPQGAIVLPGYDFDMPPAAWDSVTADHPQFGFKALAEHIGFGLSPPRWHDCPAPAPERNRLVSLSLRPAPVTDQWLSEGPDLVPDLATAGAGMTLIEAPSPRAEAEAIAVRLRIAAEQGQKAALVSPDRMLTRRVTAALARWKITPDDSAGHPLPLTPPGIFLRRIAALAGRPLLPVDLLALLKHPLCGGGPDTRPAHLEMTRMLEMKVLRGGPPFVDWQVLTGWAGDDADRLAWVGGLKAALEPLPAATAEQPLAAWLALHRQAAERLSGGPDATGMTLWDKDAGLAARDVFAELEREAGYAGTLSVTQYRALFQAVMAQRDVRDEAFVSHPGVAILGTLEARVQSADLVILGGMNEGVWPSMPPPDPWLSREMRRQIHLPPPERQTGLSAHDYQQAIAAGEVVVSRAVRDGESPTVASRWLIRLENLLEGLGPEGKGTLAEIRMRGAGLLALAEGVNAPESAVPPARRPSPAPPPAVRPAQLSVTRIERLIRDPYAIYADKVLRLRPLDPVGRAADALVRGTTLHRVMELFIEKTREGLPADAEKLLLDLTRDILEQDVPWPSTRRFWQARMEKIAAWLVDKERDRRATGTPLKTEVSGKRRLPDIEFTLTAKADRIDLLAGGTLAIYDYKSGGLPSKKQLQNFAVQLPLEGAIAQAGGFDGIAAAPVSHLELIGLGGGGKTEALDPDTVDISRVWENLGKLIAAFARPTQGYTARHQTEKTGFTGDYDHLSRFGEWQDGDEFETEIVK